VKSVLLSLQNFILDSLFPEKCIGCHCVGHILCPVCISSFKPCLRQPEQDIYACFNYHDPILKKALWSLKYYRRKSLGRILGKALYESLLETTSELYTHSPLHIIPVPLSRNRKKMRGYNQAERIAYGFCESLPKGTAVLKTNLVFKNKNTLAQATIHNRDLRLSNIQNAFSIKNSNTIVGKTIIVIDDVTTTGGTLLEIMKLLKKEGAQKVIGFAVAH
jgi:competence protein ComFC